MGDLVFDVRRESAFGCSVTVKGLTAKEAYAYLRAHPGAVITPRKLLPCAQRPSQADARIATPPSSGTTPATGRWGDL